MKKGTTKRALVLSLLSLLVCMSMLVGTTFAWFTDSVQSGNNQIVAGNLDVEMYYSMDLEDWNDVTDATDVFVAPEGVTKGKWEPGHTEVAYLKIVNEGTLALKYQLRIDSNAETVGKNEKGEDIKLSEILKFTATEPSEAPITAYTRETAQAAAVAGAGTPLTQYYVSEITLQPDKTHYIAVAVYMPEEVDNAANYRGDAIPTIDFKLTLEATQETFEKDSFDEKYDDPAALPAKAVNVSTGEELAAAAEDPSVGVINLMNDITLADAVTLPAGVTLSGNGNKIDGTIYAGGDLTIDGHVKVTAFSASYYDRTITIGEGACLEITGTGRMTLAYGNVFNITGSLTDAKTADKTTVQPSLIIPGGISITGGSDAAMNVTNAYVKIGSTTSKNSAANGTFDLNFTNSIVEFTNQLTLSEPTNGNNPTFNMNVKDSVLTTATKFIIAAPNSNVVIDNSVVNVASYVRNSGTLTLKNGSELTGSTIQFGENGGNNGTINVDASKLTVNATSTGHAFDGRGTGAINLTNGAVAAVTYYKDMTVTADATSTFTGTEVQ